MVQVCQTERLILRRLSLEDVPALPEILSYPEVMKHSVNGVCDEAATRKFVEWCLSCYESHGVGPWALIDKKASELMGFSSFDVLEFHGRPVRLYRLTSEQWEALHNNAMHAKGACWPAFPNFEMRQRINVLC